MKLKLTWQRLHSNHVLFPFHFAFSSFSCSSLIFSGHSCLLTLFIFTSVYVYSILFPSSMYSDSTLQQLIGLSYMVDSTYIVLFSLCLFTTSSKCTMFTGVVLICGFSLSLCLALSLFLYLWFYSYRRIFQRLARGLDAVCFQPSCFSGALFTPSDFELLYYALVIVCQACEGSNIYDCPSWEVGGDGNLETLMSYVRHGRASNFGATA